MPHRGIRIKRRFLITLLILLSSGPAYAEWVSVGSSESDGGFTVYTDPDTIRRKGDRVKMWELYDYQTAQTYRGSQFLSRREQSEYDCAEERYRQFAVTLFTGIMGKGNQVHNLSEEGKWQPVVPGSVGQAMRIVACAMK